MIALTLEELFYYDYLYNLNSFTAFAFSSGLLIVYHGLRCLETIN